VSLLSGSLFLTSGESGVLISRVQQGLDVGLLRKLGHGVLRRSDLGGRVAVAFDSQSGLLGVDVRKQFLEFFLGSLD